ncbi:MAG TPA: UDP-N-acetylmuramate dehydrogenase [Patescibacteria group bacterium]|nr:UDP-N-acetylmuramate dehydrogenase [Patescibacteria group bacterium]
MEERYQKIIDLLGEGKVKVGEPLASHTTFKIGGLADLFLVAETEEDLIKAVKVAREAGVVYLILGGGSNLLVGDKGFRGIVIKIRNSILRQSSGQEFKVQSLNGKYLVTVEAGVPISVLLNELVKNSVAGLEFMAGIPGTIGGAIRGNGGAWQQNIGDKVLRVKVLFLDGKISWLTKDECQFDYRTSRFKRGGGEIVLTAEFELSRGEPEEIKKKIQENLEKRSAQPKEPSAGSVFVNPKPQSAGEMIEQCGLKGAQIGGAKISEKHANFIVNVGQAKAADVVALMDLARAKVKEKFGVDLKEEIVKVGEF